MKQPATSASIVALLILSLNGCNTAPVPPGVHWDEYRLDLPRRQKPPTKKAGKCRKRGCDNHRLIFNPAEKPPSVIDLHRRW